MNVQIWQLIKGILGFIIIWLICLVAMPVFVAIIAIGQTKKFFAAKKKIDAPKVLAYVPATTDNNIHSAN